MSKPFHFEWSEVPSETTHQVRQALDSGRGTIVEGPAGSGKTHAVRRAVNGAIWSTCTSGPLAVVRLVADLASQADAGSSILSAFIKEGVSSATGALDAALGEKVVVVDAVERLGHSDIDDDEGFAEPDVVSLFSEERRAIQTWLASRVKAGPQVVVCRRAAGSLGAASIIHEQPPDWPVKLRLSTEGFIDWSVVAKCVDDNPAGLTLAAATLRLAGRPAFDAAMADRSISWRSLGKALFHHAPDELRRYLVLLGTLEEVSASALEDLTKGDEGLGMGHDLAVDLKLVEQNGDLIRPRARIFEALPLPDPSDVGAVPLLEQYGRWLLGRVNTRESRVPGDVLKVLDAHRLQLATGDIDGALTTARFHLGGLIDYARTQSIRGRFEEARRLYGGIRRLISANPGLANRRVKSYVTEYYGYNGDRANTETPDMVQKLYQEAVDDWPENALWHCRLIEATAAYGALQAARDALTNAYRVVPDHPRRDGTLRIRPAFHLRRRGASLFSLELVDELLANQVDLEDVDPIAHHQLMKLQEELESKGVEIERLDSEDGRHVIFTGQVRLFLHLSDSVWTAELRYPPARSHGDTPCDATRRLACEIADEVLRFVRTPTGRLGRHDVGRKGLYLGAVDLAASNLGIAFASSRWLLGRIEGVPPEFVPTDTSLTRIPLAVPVPESSRGLFFGRFPIDRTGRVAGSVDRLIPAGSGRSLADVEGALRLLRCEGSNG